MGEIARKFYLRKEHMDIIHKFMIENKLPNQSIAVQKIIEKVCSIKKYDEENTIKPRLVSSISGKIYGGDDYEADQAEKRPPQKIASLVSVKEKHSRIRPSETEISLHIGNNIRSIRINRGLKLEEISARVGISWQQLSKYETGETRISTSMLVRIARALRVDPGTFYDGLEDPSTGEIMSFPEKNYKSTAIKLSLIDRELNRRISAVIETIIKLENNESKLY